MLLVLLASGFLLGGLAMRRLVEQPIQTTEALNFDYTKASPIAFVPIMASTGAGIFSGMVSRKSAETVESVGWRAIPHNHKLQLTVSLTMPESEYNRKLGVFQVRVDLLSANGKITASSSYPTMLRFKSPPIRFIETIFKAAPLLAGFQSETQILNIKSNDFSEGYKPTVCLKVTIEPRAEYQSGAGIPQIYAASLTLESELPQLKKIIWYWRRTIFVWISLMSFLAELMIVLIFFRPLIMPRGRLRAVGAKMESHKNKISLYRSF
ncbi:Seipin-3 [Camellia lanceoleosa]|uniref:Seipin-3 n=1 Tax=Camellia lanceoleosa TaxID=1840588 RepID=A0ACC0H0E4_9ERIC|nr:Seipin-3 [Camellia lanceoleosa]